MLFLFLYPVDSNDSLYGGDSRFLSENSKLCEAAMVQILEHLKTLAKDEVGTTAGQGSHKVVHCEREMNQTALFSVL